MQHKCRSHSVCSDTVTDLRLMPLSLSLPACLPVCSPVCVPVTLLLRLLRILLVTSLSAFISHTASTSTKPPSYFVIYLT